MPHAHSLGSALVGVPSEIIQGASRIATEHASVLASGPANCTEAADGEEETDIDNEVQVADNCAGVLDCGVDDVTPIHIWDQIMKRYKVAQSCEEDLFRFSKVDEPDEKAVLQQRQATAVAEAV